MDVNASEILYKLKTFIDTHSLGVSDGLIANLLWAILFGFVSFFLSRRLYKKYKNTVQDVGFQTYIFGEISYVVCKNDNYKIFEIPRILLEFREKLKIKRKQDEVYFWNTRISTFIVFTDGKRVLLFNRRSNTDKEAIHNPKMDVYGAKAFHNASLKYKIPSTFMNSTIVNMHSIPGIVIEENKVPFKLFKKGLRHETVIMIGFIAYLKPEDLEKGLDIESNDEITIDSDDNLIFPITCLNAEDENLTSKARISIKYLHSLQNKVDDEEKCKKYCGKKPFIYTTEIILSRDNLTEISGIGSEIQKMLYKLGIYKFEQIANWTDDNIEWIQEYLYFPDRVKRERWVEQARKIL